MTPDEAKKDLDRALTLLRCDAWRWNDSAKRYDDVRDDVAVVEAALRAKDEKIADLQSQVTHERALAHRWAENVDALTAERDEAVALKDKAFLVARDADSTQKAAFKMLSDLKENVEVAKLTDKMGLVAEIKRSQEQRDAAEKALADAQSHIFDLCRDRNKAVDERDEAREKYRLQTESVREWEATVERLDASRQAQEEQRLRADAAESENKRLSASLGKMREALTDIRNDDCGLTHDGTVCCLKEAGIESAIEDVLALSQEPHAGRHTTNDCYAVSASHLGKHGYFPAADFLYGWAYLADSLKEKP